MNYSVHFTKFTFLLPQEQNCRRSNIKASPYETIFGAEQKMGLDDSPFTEDMYSSLETGEERKELFNTGMNNIWDKGDRKGANQRPRKDEDKKQINETSKETIEKKDDKKYLLCDLWEVIKCSQVLSLWHFVHIICGGYSKDCEGFEEKMACDLCVRKNRINNERIVTKCSQEQEVQKMVSLSNSRLPPLYNGTNVVVRMPDVDWGRLGLETPWQLSFISTLLNFINRAPMNAYFSGYMLAVSPRLLIISSMQIMCPEIHYLFRQPQR